MKKNFDCVEMKWEIQRKIHKKYAGVPEEEARRRQWAEILADPIVGSLLAKVLSREKTPASR